MTTFHVIIGGLIVLLLLMIVLRKWKERNSRTTQPR